ncbi:peptidase U62 modulator of DNA gyrase [Stanieria cyanosphaera PCC 7437]|uniref:Peptidase U62 modulator of DNA gyrase n=1 Tax=Stanieria cyanosphaera (strain ATCC 29371 / PCC 7437) TaxID=111780 RepID=K9XMZ8_STAC7|nr:TldD/PmbA family protein [Stanieria cyanosphaera]AFZ33893.1 peptidase U62 modulator of DNA gyrase [Stanieria cyanosphaera PCC 7437]
MTLATTNTLITQEEALALIESTIKQSQAEGVFVSLSNSESALSRFCENQISQNIRKNRFKLSIISYFGKSSASASTTELDPEAIKQTVRRSEELARFAPADPEWMPLLPPQNYESRTPAFDLATASLSPLAKGEMLQQICLRAKNAGVNGSGTLSSAVSLQAIGNSAGLRVCDRTTEADFSFTARQEDGSSWNNRTAWSIEQLPLESITEEVIQKAIASRQPRPIKPGNYTVIFEPAAMGSLLPWVIWNLDARAADEGRSFMSCRDLGRAEARSDQKGQFGNRVGERIFSPLLQVQRNSAHPLLQGSTFFGDGLSNNYLEIIKDGIPQTLSYSRYWAQQQQQTATGAFYPLVMKGSSQSLSDLIAQTKQGILVSRAWYVRSVNPKTLEVTGMTRDGTFLIENGQLVYPVKNLRFNQSLPEMLANLEAVGKVQRCGSNVIPGCKITNFHFSSVTDSI